MSGTFFLVIALVERWLVTWQPELPPAEALFTAVNREFFATHLSAVGSPGGAHYVGPLACDHPVVSACPARILR
jgi:hypothetical protein